MGSAALDEVAPVAARAFVGLSTPVLHPTASPVDESAARYPVRSVLARMGVVAARAVRIGGTRNIHWRIVSGDRTYVLRRYRADRSRAEIDYELTVLDRLRADGLPVAAATDEPIAHGDRWWALFPHLPGTIGHRRPEDRRSQFRRGVLLAELHAALAAITLDQRPGWRSCIELAREGPDELVAHGRRRLVPPGHEALADRIGAHASSCLGVEAARAVPFRPQVVHGDFTRWNLLFTGDRVSGILDFDEVRTDDPVVDLACARRSHHDGVVDGYASVTPVGDAERRALALLWRVHTLGVVAQLLQAPVLTTRVVDGLSWCVSELDATAAGEIR